MYSTFESLPDEKREKIINACIDEFADRGYVLASTNTIIKNAGISKGILFHYFKNKKNLFLYIIDYAVEVTKKKVYGAMENQPPDILDRIINSGLIKLRISFEYPKLYKILMDAYGDMPDELKFELQERYNKSLEEAMPFILKDIDTSKFRSDIDRDKAIEWIIIAVEGLGNKYLKKFKNMEDNGILVREKAIEDMKGYFEMLKYGIYKKNE